MSQEKAIDNLRQQVARLQWDKETASVRGYNWMVEMYDCQLRRLWAEVAGIQDNLWRLTYAQQWDESCKGLLW